MAPSRDIVAERRPNRRSRYKPHTEAHRSRIDLKIIHLITSLNTGGAEVMLAKLLASMDRARFENAVISLTVKGNIGAQIEKSGIRVTCLGTSGTSAFVRAAWQFRRILHRERPDIVQSWLPHADLVATVASPFSGRDRLIWNVRSSWLDLNAYPRSFRWTLRLLAALSAVPNAVVVNSNAGRQFHESLGFRPHRWVFIPNGFALDRFRPRPEQRLPMREEYGIPPGALVVAMVARFDPMKRHDIFLRAAALVRRSLPEAYFLLAGAGIAEHEEIRALAKPLRGHVHFTGAVDDVPRLYAGVDVAINCSSYGEGFSNSIGEAMACAVPCVVTDIGDSATIVAGSGRIVPPADAGSLAAAVIELLAMPATDRAALGAMARKRVEQEFSIDAIARRYEALYEDVVASRS